MARRLPFLLVGMIAAVLVGVVIVAGGIYPQTTSYPTPPPNGNLGPPPPGPNWSRLNPANSPSNNSSMMAYLPMAGELLLVDSDGGCSPSNSWTFSGGTWQNVTALVNPGPDPARGLGGLVYDGADGYLVLFGGSSPCGVYNDTWTFANSTWSRLATTIAPPPLYGFAMTYDASDGYVLLTGGCCINGEISRETWTFQHGQWTNLTQSPSPVVDLDSGMTYDSTLGEVVFVGGYASGFVSQATWTFHNGTWLRVYPAVSPSNRAGIGLAFDGALKKDVLVGGYTKVTKGVWVNLTDTWTYGGGHWQNLTGGLTASPPFASGPTLMAYDSASKEIVMFLGYDQTWVFG